MFKDLDWGWAFKRAGIVVLIYLALMYVLSNVAPDTFQLDNAAAWQGLIVNAFFFFFVFAFVYAFIERSRRRRVAEMQAKSGKSGNSKNSRNPKSKTHASGNDEDDSEPGPLKGQMNPNMSRKKATRRRR